MIEFKNRVKGKQRFLGKHIAISSSAIISVAGQTRVIPGMRASGKLQEYYKC